MTTENNRITQDVPIRMLNRRQIEEKAEPSLDEPEVKFEMPKIKTLRNVISRMKSVGEDLMLTATSSGTLTLQVTSDMVTIKTFYRNLKIPEGDDEKKEQEPITAQCRMNIKKISQVLKTNLVSRMSHYVVGCIIESQAFVVYAEMGQNFGNATFYIPLLTL